MKKLFVFFMMLLLVTIYHESVAYTTYNGDTFMVTKKKVVKKKPFKRLTKKEYAKALQHPKWQKKRLRVFNRDKWKCRECGDTETTLHVHHLKYTKKYPWNELFKNLQTLCSTCHFRSHGNRAVIR